MMSLDSIGLQKGELLPVMEQFYTIQGEGFHTGKASYFIRIGGCDVGCHWCDVKESWDANIHPLTKVKDVIENAKINPSKTIVLTGGEPSQYNLDEICMGLIKEGFQIHLETSGAHKLSGNFHWICLSPKKNMPPHESVFQMANELKVIIYNKHDFLWAEENARKVNLNCYIYLQPEWSKKNEITPLIIDYVMKNPKWKISLQTHKYINVP